MALRDKLPMLAGQGYCWTTDTPPCGCRCPLVRTDLTSVSMPGVVQILTNGIYKHIFQRLGLEKKLCGVWSQSYCVGQDGTIREIIPRERRCKKKLNSAGLCISSALLRNRDSLPVDHGISVCRMSIALMRCNYSRNRFEGFRSRSTVNVGC